MAQHQMPPPSSPRAFPCVQVLDRQPSVGRKIDYLLKTGNLVSSTGLDLMQTSGFTVVADKVGRGGG